MREEWVDLAGRARDGDMEAFERLVDRFKRPLCAVVHPIVRDWHLTQDVAQDAFVVAWRRIRELRDPVSFRQWLFRIARNSAVSRIRRASVVRMSRFCPATESRAVDLPRGPECGIHAGDRPRLGREKVLEKVVRVVMSLPNDYGTVLLMHHAEGMSLTDMAEILGRTPKAIKAVLYRARVLARDYLARSGLDYERVLDEM